MTILASILAAWTLANGAFVYVMFLRHSPRSRPALFLGALTWPVSAPVELTYHLAKPAIVRFLEKVLP